jgi:hypothetical protein
MRGANLIVRADSAICHSTGECELSGKVTVIRTTPKAAAK